MKMFRIVELLLVCCGISYCQSYDGRWWASSSYQSRVGYLNGESGCYQYEVRGIDRGFRSVDEELKYLDDFYKISGDQKITISDALRRSRKKPVKKSSASQDGDPHLKKHGYYDGGWWREIDSDPAREGFIEGYLSCRNGSGYSISKAELFRIRLSISKWYLSNPSRSDLAIAELIQMFSGKRK
jgi:hypothetical protein